MVDLKIKPNELTRCAMKEEEMETWNRSSKGRECFPIDEKFFFFHRKAHPSVNETSNH